VGEVVPGSPSAREIAGLWTYIQDKLSRIVRDAKLIPDIRPAEFAISPLAAAVEEEDLSSSAIEDVPQAAPVTNVYSDPIKLAGPEPRANIGSNILKGPDRRMHVFGRRQGGQGP